MKRAVLYISLIAALPLLSGCENEFSWGAGVGTPITFSANSYYENGPSTRTEYSNDFVGTNPTYERINWVADDLIRISATDGNSNASASYTIVGSSIAASGQNSNATVTLASGSSELQWMSDATHTFYAFYGNNAASSTGKTITATLPEAQNGTRVGSTNVYKPNMGYAYMWAAKSTAPTNEGVSLEFSPLMTAFEVTVGAQGTSTLNIKSFTLESTSTTISGSFKATINDNLQGYTLSDISGTKKITVSFGSAGVDVTNSNPATFTVFAIPQATGLKDLKMTFTLADGSKTIALNYNGSPYTFAAGKKYKITNVYVPEPEVWDFHIDEIDNITTYGHNPVSGLSFTVNSYKYSNLAPTHVPVSWTAEVISVTNAVAGDLDAQSWSGNGNNNQKPVAIVNPSSNEYPDQPADAGSAAAAKLASNPYRGSADSEPPVYWDLSRHKFYGTEAQMTATASQETANCYVVSSPGLYKFPLVYGNAISAGGTNTSAYNPGGTTSSTYLATFLNYAGNEISSPYILTDIGNVAVSTMEAVVVWQDVPEEKIILRTGNYGVGGTSASDAFMWFKIDPEDIKQGNIVLALRRKSDKVIVWSWHIWITEKVDESDFVMTLEYPITSTTAGSLGMMKYNLGWTDASNATGYAYPTRVWTIKVTLTENNSITKTFTITQIGDAKQVPANIGTNTFYQWGRKDPELPARNSLQNKQFYSNDGYNPDGGRDESGNYILKRYPSSLNIPNTIMNPDTHYSAFGGTVWTSIINLWDADESAYNHDAYVNKTVYDPCPPGFSVPRRNAFMVFTRKSDGSWETGNTGRPANGDLSGNNGYNFFTKRNRQGQRIFFPMTGARREQSEFQAIFELGYYWTAAQTSAGIGKSLQFNQDYVYANFDQKNSAGYTIRPCTEE